MVDCHRNPEPIREILNSMRIERNRRGGRVIDRRQDTTNGLSDLVSADSSVLDLSLDSDVGSVEDHGDSRFEEWMTVLVEIGLDDHRSGWRDIWPNHQRNIFVHQKRRLELDRFSLENGSDVGFVVRSRVSIDDWFIIDCLNSIGLTSGLECVVRFNNVLELDSVDMGGGGD
jgi:hypothetical protein